MPDGMAATPRIVRVTLEVSSLDEAASFYVTDPWGNDLCFVDEGTLYT
jgi:hypothetical protein